MYLWQKLVLPGWWATNELALREHAHEEVAVIARPGHKRLTIEVAHSSRRRADALMQQFGGRIEKLSRNWLERFARKQKSKPLRIGKRLLITNVRGIRAGLALSRHESCSHIVIPAGAAFGTGQHVTTAMGLRLLEQVTRSWHAGWSLADLGTGSGILALAAKRFGARSVFAIDIDAVAISTARANAHRNRIGGIEFRIADVRRCKLPRGMDILAANLFTELLIEILPRLKQARWLILSGMLRRQEWELSRALQQNDMEVVKVRRRGKWSAILAAN
jgi:ribosomal protein L11 methyltransferase